MKKFIHKIMYNFLLARRRMFHTPIPIGKPKVSVNVLISRCLDSMKIKPFCPYCGIAMHFRDSKLVGRNPIRNDIHFKCPHCFHCAHFGIPLTKEEYDKELDLRQGIYLMSPNVSFEVFSKKDRKEILERLEALGYLEL